MWSMIRFIERSKHPPIVAAKSTGDSLSFSAPVTIGCFDLKIGYQQQIEDVHSILRIENNNGSTAWRCRYELTTHDWDCLAVGQVNRERTKRGRVEDLLQPFDSHPVHSRIMFEPAQL